KKTPARFGEEVIRFADPDGLVIELIASISSAGFEPWADSTVPVEHSLHGFHGVSIALEGYEQTARLLTETFGYRLVEQLNNRFRLAAPSEAGAGRIVDLLCRPNGSPGRAAPGSVHHIASRALDAAETLAWRERPADAAYHV